MDNRATRESATFFYSLADLSHLYIRANRTSIGYTAGIFLSSVFKHRIGVRFDSPGESVIFVYVVDRNAYDLLRSRTPPWVVLDALIETHDSAWIEFWSNEKQIPEARSLLERLALMELIPVGEE